MDKPILYIDLNRHKWWKQPIQREELIVKAVNKPKISRKQAKEVHKDLPPGGRWVTIEGNHVYIKNHKIIAGALPWMKENGEVEAKKAEDHHLKELQEKYDRKRAKEERKAQKKQQEEQKVTAQKPEKKPVEESKHTPGTKEYWHDIVSKRTLSEGERQRVQEAKHLSEEDKKHILSEDKKRRREELASVERERQEREIKESLTESRKKREEERALRKRKEQEKEMNVRKLAPKGGEKAKAPDMKRVEIAPNTSEEHKKAQERENQPIKEAKSNPKGKYRELLDKLNEDWKKEAGHILSKPVAERDNEEIKKLAQKLTKKYEPIAIQEAERYAHLMNAKKELARLTNKNNEAIKRYHENALNDTKEIVEGSGLYGDIQQSARATLYETLHNLLSGAEKMDESRASVAQHVIRRIQTHLYNDLYGEFNPIKVPERLRPAIADMKKHEEALTKKLGRKPTDEELAKHLHENSEAFRKATIRAKKWDKKKQRWVATKGEKNNITDPVERLKVLRELAGQQKTDTIDRNIGKEGEKELTVADTIEAEHASPEEKVVEEQHKKELKEKVPQALKKFGLKDQQIAVLMEKFNSPHGEDVTHDEVAERLNKHYKHLFDGKKVTGEWVRQTYSRALRKLQEAADKNHKNHAAWKELRSLMAKSLFGYHLFRQLYLFDLVKSLNLLGIDYRTLKEQYVRTETAESVEEVKKSLAPYEHISGTAITKDGKVRARIVELVLPERNEVFKSFNTYMHGDMKERFTL